MPSRLMNSTESGATNTLCTPFSSSVTTGAGSRFWNVE